MDAAAVPSPPPVEVLPRDLAPFRRGNAGIDYVHTFDSGRPGPHVMINALTHGNELCGMTALCFLLDRQVRPRRGRMTLSFANVAAYGRFDPEHPFDSRFVDRDFNRVWSAAVLDRPDGSAEVARAAELRPLVERVDALLDLHSTTFDVPPMLCYRQLGKHHALAGRLCGARRHIVSSGGKHKGAVMFEYGRFGDPADPALGMLIECGQHFARRSGEVAIAAAVDFLDFFGMAEPALVRAFGSAPDETPPMLYEVSEVVVADSDGFRFIRPFRGFEEFAEGELIALDGSRELRAPYDRCTLIMPRRVPMQGAEVVTLARRL